MKTTISALIRPYRSVSIIGMCKNAGKTTGRNQLIRELNGNGQTLALTVTGKGGCYVYNADGSLAASTYLFGDTSVTLPENGWIVFAGEVGARLQLQRQ